MFKAEVNVKDVWVPTGEVRTLRNGETRENLIKVHIANVTLTAESEVNTLWWAHNLRISRVRRGGQTYYTLSEMREERDRWTGEVTVNDKWTRVKGVSGRPDNLSLMEVAKLLKSWVGVEEAVSILPQIQ